jgi:site-specific DNA-cytosine methylase
LKDILQEDVDEKYNCSELQIEKALSWKHQQDNIQTTDGKARTLVAWTHGNAAHYTKTLIDIVDGEVRVKQATKQWYIVAEEWDWISLSYPTSTTRRGRVIEQKSNTLTASWWDSYVYDKVRIRKLTPIECERLQTLQDNYTEWVSDSQRYKMLWNWWTVDVIAHIFRFIK